MGRSKRTGNAFFGRTLDLSTVEAKLVAGARLVTITGPPGIGKTRFARELSSSLARGAFATRDVEIVELAPARTAADVALAVADALGAPAVGDPVVHVARVLAARPGQVLFLDELEHLVALASDTIGVWLDASPVVFVVTSRILLGLGAELIHDLPPLALPERRARPRGRDAPVAADAGAARDLFVDRARAAGAGDAVERAPPDLVSEIVRRLEGVPLAIELAAGRLRVLSLEELGARLGRSLAVLGGGAGRHATLAEAIEASWTLLTEPERAALAQASVFEGSFDVVAAEAVLDLGRHGGQVLDAIEGLVDKSMLQRRVDEDGGVRLALLESVRAFVAEHLEQYGGGSAARRRHAEHHARRGAAIVDALAGAITPGEASTLRRRLIGDRQNLVAAVREALATPEVGPDEARIAVGAATALYEASRALGRRVAEAESLLDAVALARRARSIPDDVNRSMAGALVRAADALRLRGHNGPAIVACDEAMVIAVELVVSEVGDAALSARGDARAPHDHLSAQADLERAIATFEELERGPHRPARRRLLARSHLRLARLHHRGGAPEMAIEHARAAADAAESIKDAREEAEAHCFLAAACAEIGDIAQVRASCARACSLTEGTGDGSVPAFVDYALGSAKQEEGDLEEAADLYVRGADRHWQLGNLRAAALPRLHLARLEIERGRAEEALRILPGVIATFEQTGYDFARALAFAALAVARARLGDVDGARRALVCAGSQANPTIDACVRIAAAIVDGTASDGAAFRAPDLLEMAARSEDVRTMLRLARSGSSGERIVLAVGPGCSWFAVDGARRVDLSKRRSAAALLVALVDRHHVAPGDALALDALVRAGWSGERMRPEAAANRVYVAISTLRRLGLRGALLHGDDGWLLDRRVVVVEAPAN